MRWAILIIIILLILNSLDFNQIGDGAALIIILLFLLIPFVLYLISKKYVKKNPNSMASRPKEDYSEPTHIEQTVSRYNRYTDEDDDYKYCPDCFLKNPDDRWYCIECGHAFAEGEPTVTSHEHPFEYSYWLSPKFRTKHQRTRFRRASQIQMKSHTPDFYHATVYSSDRSSLYEVTPEECSCQDFFKRGLPCKHMYAVMIEANVLSSIASLYNLPRNISARIDNLHDISKDSAREFALFLRYKRFNSNSVIVDRSNDVFAHLPNIVSSSLIEINFSTTDLIAYVEKTYTVDEFREVCSAVAPELELPKLKKHDLIEFALSQKLELSEYFSNLVYFVRIPDDVFTHRRDIFDYYFEEHPDAV